MGRQGQGSCRWCGGSVGEGERPRLSPHSLLRSLLLFQRAKGRRKFPKAPSPNSPPHRDSVPGCPGQGGHWRARPRDRQGLARGHTAQLGPPGLRGLAGRGLGTRRDERGPRGRRPFRHPICAAVGFDVGAPGGGGGGDSDSGWKGSRGRSLPGTAALGVPLQPSKGPRLAQEPGNQCPGAQGPPAAPHPRQRPIPPRTCGSFCPRDSSRGPLPASGSSRWCEGLLSCGPPWTRLPFLRALLPGPLPRDSRTPCPRPQKGALEGGVAATQGLSKSRS